MDNLPEKANGASETSKLVLELIERAGYPERIEDEVRKAIETAEDKEKTILKLWIGAYCLQERMRKNELAAYGGNPTEEQTIKANRTAANDSKLYDAVYNAIMKYQ